MEALYITASIIAAFVLVYVMKKLVKLAVYIWNDSFGEDKKK